MNCSSSNIKKKGETCLNLIKVQSLPRRTLPVKRATNLEKEEVIIPLKRDDVLVKALNLREAAV